MRRRIFKSWAAVLLAILCLFSCALADTVTKDGIEVTLTTDKQHYQAGERIQVSVSVTNLSERLFKPISVEYDIPDTCMHIGAESVMYNTLEEQETETLSTTLQVIPLPQNVVPKTGDDSNLFFWLFLACGGFWGAARMKPRTRRRLFAALIAAAMVGTSFLQADSVKAQEKKNAEEDVMLEIAVSETVKIMGEPEKITANVIFMDMSAAASYAYSGMIGLPLHQTMNEETEIVYDAVYGDENTALPESLHPYEVNRDEIYVIHGGEGTTQMSLHFDDHCEVEKNYDALLIYDGNGEYVTYYTGTAMRNKEIVTPGECAYIRLVTDNTVTKYGFGFKKIVPHKASVVKTIYLNSSNKPVIQWEKLDGHKGFAIERASISDTGSIGTFKRIANKTTSSATSYTDTKASVNKAYAYRVYQYMTTNGKRYASPASQSENIFVLAHPVLKSGKASVTDEKPQITLKWGAVKNALEYRIYRCDTKDGEYAYIGSSSETTYVDTLEKKAQYYYKVKAYTEYAGEGYESAFSTPKNYGFLVAPLSLTAVSAGSTKVKLSWPKVTKAKGYAIYRSDREDGEYKLIARTTSVSKTVSAVGANMLSYYKVKAYTKSGGKYVYSDDETQVAAIYPLPAAKGLSAVSSPETGEVMLSWKPVENATYYEIYFSKSSGGTYTLHAQSAEPYAVLSGFADDLKTVYFKVRAYRTDEEIVSPGVLSGYVKLKRNLTTVRNLYVYEQYAPAGASMVTYEPDRVLLDGMFEKATPFGRQLAVVKGYTDQSKSQLKSRINAMAKLADSNDVTVFVLSCHGNDSEVYGEMAGALALSDGSTLKFKELASWLKKIPGRVVIMLTACGSGSSIDKFAASSRAAQTLDAQTFLENFIKVIKEYDEPVAADDAVTFGAARRSLELMPANGELMVSGKFYVIATAPGGESGWYNNRDGSMLMRWMSQGVMGADANHNGTVTLAEMGDFLTMKGDTTLINGTERMYPQVYPDASDFALFKQR